MKRELSLSLLGALVFALSACSYGDSNSELHSGGLYRFTEGEIHYYYDELVAGVGSYGIFLHNANVTGDSYNALYLDFASDYFEDAQHAIPADGVYICTETFLQFTFNNKYSWYLEKTEGTETVHGIVGGMFTLVRNDSEYYIVYNLTLGVGSTVKGEYRGELSRAQQTGIRL